MASRLAYVDTAGVHVVGLDATGARSAAPVLASAGEVPADSVRDLAWSANGRWLGWLQAGGAGQLVLYDSRAGSRRSWPVPAGELAVTDAGAVVLTDDHLTVYSPSDAVGRSVPATVGGEGLTVGARTPDTTHFGTPVASFAGGFVVDDQLAAERHRLVLLPPDGTGRYLGDAEQSGAPWGTAAVSADGRTLAVERGDHTDFCGVGPASELALVDLTTGAQQLAPAPVPGSRGTPRIQQLSSAQGTWGASVASCEPGVDPHPSAYFEFTSGSWVLVKDAVLAAARGPGGLLAFSAGRWRGESQPEIVGTGALTVEGPQGQLPLDTSHDFVWAPTATAG
jgi:hypothetical protein